MKTANGPVSLSNLTGSVDVEAANGPVSLKGSSGDVKIRAVNGPLTIALAGTRWEGKGLEADAKNGPLTLKLPDGKLLSLNLTYDSLSGSTPNGALFGKPGSFSTALWQE